MDLRSYMLTRKEVLKGLNVKERLIKVKENRNFIVSIVGPRRAGKTYFLYHLIRKRGLKDEDFVLINFEEPVALKELDEALAVRSRRSSKAAYPPTPRFSRSIRSTTS